ncbi:MAG: class I SAM-dependent methyltransferase, partial [Pseudomonadota bacterium]
MNEHGLACRQYVHREMKRVDGWLSILDAELVTACAIHQHVLGIDGSVGEIGVHHGKLFVLLCLTRSLGESALAIDLFADQVRNIDRSGEGSRSAFEANLIEFLDSSDEIQIIEGDSLNLTWCELSKVVSPLRLLSVDGGHTARCAANDLRIADDALVDQGIVLLDDYFNPEFPGVSEGYAAFSAERPNRLTPFAIGDNKVLLSRPAHRELFANALTSAIADTNLVKLVEFQGFQTPVFRTPRRMYDKLKQNPIAKRHRGSYLGRRLKPVIRRL